MEKFILSSSNSIQQNIKRNSISDQNYKFIKLDSTDNLIINPPASKVCRDVINGINIIQQQVMRIDNIHQNQPIHRFQRNTYSQDFQEPKGISVKFNIFTEKNPNRVILNRSKSQFKGKNSKRYFSNTIYKSAANQDPFSKTQNRKLFASHKRQFSDTQYQKVQINQSDKPAKKVRLKANSVISLAEQFSSKSRSKKQGCIPLKQFQPQQQNNYFQNLYRLRKGQIPAWYQLSKFLQNLADKKSNVKKGLTIGKEKRIFEGYDFNGELIHSANYVPKVKKTNEEIEMEVQNKEVIENSQFYHDRQKRNAREIFKISMPPSLNSGNYNSCFLSNFQRIEWDKRIQNKPLFSVEQNQNCERIQKLQKPTKDAMIVQQQKKQQQAERLLQQFQKIKFSSVKGQDRTDSFKYGLSKYLKAKKLEDTDKKPRSPKSVSYKFLTFSESNKPVVQAKQLKKNSQKVRANKKLFKRFFDLSLKFIQPENRQDLVTVKRISFPQDENVQEQTRGNLKQNRNSDSSMLRQPKAGLAKNNKNEVSNSRVRESDDRPQTGLTAVFRKRTTSKLIRHGPDGPHARRSFAWS